MLEMGYSENFRKNLLSLIVMTNNGKWLTVVSDRTTNPEVIPVVWCVGRWAESNQYGIPLHPPSHILFIMVFS